MKHSEIHRTHRVGWLRAAVLGANDGIVSTASLIVGVAAAHSSRSSVLVAGLAGVVGYLLSMFALPLLGSWARLALAFGVLGCYWSAPQPQPQPKP